MEFRPLPQVEAPFAPQFGHCFPFRQRGQRRFEDFVNVLGGRRRPMGMRPMLGPRFSAGLLGLHPRRPLGEGSRLPFAAARRFVEAFLEIGDSLLEFDDFAIALRASRAWIRIHEGKVGNRDQSSCEENYLAGR